LLLPLLDALGNLDLVVVEVLHGRFLILTVFGFILHLGTLLLFQVVLSDVLGEFSEACSFELVLFCLLSL
jgi:hypothetical protein